MKTQSFLIVAAILISAGPGSAGESGSIVPCRQIVNDALAHSIQLQMTEQEVHAADARQAQAKAQGWAVLDVQAAASHYEGLEQSMLGPQLIIPLIDDRYNASIGLTQPVFTGGRIHAQKTGADFQKKAADHSQAAATADLILQAQTVYWNWAKAFHSVEVFKDALKRIEAHTADVRNQRDAGMATDNDKLAAEVLLDQTRLRLEEASRRVEMARAQIAFLTGYELKTEAAPEQAIPKTQGPISTERALVQTAVANREETSARQLETKASEAMVKAARADAKPQLFLSARYEQARPNMLDFPPADEWKDDWFAGVAMTWTLFDWGLVQARAREASARLAQARLRQQLQDEQITLEVKEARINLQNAIDRMGVTEHAENSARQNLATATDLWKNGMARHSDVLDAQAELTDAENERILARVDSVLADAALDHAVGSTRNAPKSSGGTGEK